MRPHPAAIMSGTTAWQQSKVPIRLTVDDLLQFVTLDLEELLERRDAGVVHDDRGRADAVAELGDRRVDAGPVGDVDGKAMALPPSASMPCAAAAAVAPSRSQMATVAPSMARRLAMASPMPDHPR